MVSGAELSVNVPHCRSFTRLSPVRKDCEASGKRDRLPWRSKAVLAQAVLRQGDIKKVSFGVRQPSFRADPSPRIESTAMLDVTVYCNATVC